MGVKDTQNRTKDVFFLKVLRNIKCLDVTSLTLVF